MQKLIISAITIATMALATPSVFAAQKTQKQKAAAAKSISINLTTKDFSEINIGGNTQLNITVGQPRVVAVIGTQQIANCVNTHVINGMLYIHRLNTPACEKTQNIQLDINTPKLTSIMTHGNNVTKINQANTHVFMSYSSGNSHVSISGQTDSINAVLDGESSLDAKHFKANSTMVNASGNAQIAVNAKNVLFVQATGNSQIQYSGKPDRVIKSLSGNSTLTKSN